MKKPRGHQWKGKLIIGQCQSPLRQPEECGCAITEPDYQHPPADAASGSGNNAAPTNGGTGKTVWIFRSGGHIENLGQVMFAPGICGELGKPSIYHRREWNGAVGWYKPVHRHAWDIAIQMGTVLYPEGETVSFIIQGHNQFTLLDF